MTFGFGEDFRQARKRWLYDSFSGQRWWVAALLAVVLFGVLSVLQTGFGFLAYGLFYGNPFDMQGGVTELANSLAKASIVGLAPASLLAAAVTWWVAGLFNPSGVRGIPLHLPRLGALGWVAVLGLFAIAVYIIFAATFLALGIDPTTYQPSSNGVANDSSMAGMVEKALADLSDEPFLFALAIPGVAFAVPIVEELIFRGALFSALLQTRLGKSGTVVVTAAIWSLCHGMAAPWLFIAIIFMMGLLLGFLLLRFGSLWVTIACHCLWNGISSVSIFSLTGAS